MRFDAAVKESFIEGAGPRPFVAVPMRPMRHVKCCVLRRNGEKVLVEGATLGVTFEDFSSEVHLRLDAARFTVGEHVHVEVLESRPVFAAA
jgi:hypothetical protein